MNTDIHNPIIKNTPNYHSNVLAAIALLAALLAGVAIGLCWKQLKNAQTRSAIHIKELKTSIEKQQVMVQDMALQMSNMQSSLQRQQTDTNYNQVQLQRLLQNNPANVENHILLEAHYLVREAMLNLNFGHDVSAAILLLQTADQRVQSINDPNLTKVRQIFASHIAALQAVPAIDLEGLLSQLNAVREQIDKLPLLSIPQQPLPTLLAAQEKNTETGWRKALSRNLEAIQKLIVIRHRDEPVVPLLAPDQQIYLRQNLQLLLQQAEWAVLHRQSAVYQASLQESIRWIKRYFHSNEKTTQVTLDTLSGLQKINISPPLPSIAPVLDILKQTLAQRTGTSPSSTLPPLEPKKNHNTPAAPTSIRKEVKTQ